MRNKNKEGDLGQKGTETSLIEQFLYPKYGPGSLWEEVARAGTGDGWKGLPAPGCPADPDP